MQRLHHRDMREHRIAAVLADQHQALDHGFRLWQRALVVRQLGDLLHGVAKRHQWLSARQLDRIEQSLIPRHAASVYTSRSVS
jgi:hypothetical protein